MSWNYRILNHGDHLALHEVHYDGEGNVNGWTESPVDFGCGPEEGAEGIISSLRMALADAERHGVLDARKTLPSKVEQGTPAEPCPFCGAPAALFRYFPQSNQPWFVSVRHLPDCELHSADGARQCHATEAAALASWNKRSLTRPARTME